MTTRMQTQKEAKRTTCGDAGSTSPPPAPSVGKKQPSPMTGKKKKQSAANTTTSKKSAGGTKTRNTSSPPSTVAPAARPDTVKSTSRTSSSSSTGSASSLGKKHTPAKGRVVKAGKTVVKGTNKSRNSPTVVSGKASPLSTPIPTQFATSRSGKKSDGAGATASSSSVSGSTSPFGGRQGRATKRSKPGGVVALGSAAAAAAAASVPSTSCSNASQSKSGQQAANPQQPLSTTATTAQAELDTRRTSTNKTTNKATCGKRSQSGGARSPPQPQRCVSPPPPPPPSSSSIPLTPTPNDIICGQGLASYHHVGNRRYRLMITTRLPPPNSSAERVHSVAKGIVETLKGCDPPGRFLHRRAAAGGGGGGKGGEEELWTVMAEDVAIRRTVQTLREVERALEAREGNGGVGAGGGEEGASSAAAPTKKGDEGQAVPVSSSSSSASVVPDEMPPSSSPVVPDEVPTEAAAAAATTSSSSSQPPAKTEQQDGSEAAAGPSALPSSCSPPNNGKAGNKNPGSQSEVDRYINARLSAIAAAAAETEDGGEKKDDESNNENKNDNNKDKISKNDEDKGEKKIIQGTVSPSVASPSSSSSSLLDVEAKASTAQKKSVRFHGDVVGEGSIVNIKEPTLGRPKGHHLSLPNCDVQKEDGSKDGKPTAGKIIEPSSSSLGKDADDDPTVTASSSSLLEVARAMRGGDLPIPEPSKVADDVGSLLRSPTTTLNALPPTVPASSQSNKNNKPTVRYNGAFVDTSQFLPDLVPTNNDVLCGRGLTFFNHIGNRRFRILVELNLPAYTQAQKKDAKSQISKNIVDTIKGCYPPGRFLRKDTKSGKWLQLSYRSAREKTGQTFREGGRLMRMHFKEMEEASSTSSDDLEEEYVTTREECRGGGGGDDTTQRWPVPCPSSSDGLPSDGPLPEGLQFPPKRLSEEDHKRSLTPPKATIPGSGTNLNGSSAAVVVTQSTRSGKKRKSVCKSRKLPFTFNDILLIQQGIFVDLLSGAVAQANEDDSDEEDTIVPAPSGGMIAPVAMSIAVGHTQGVEGMGGGGIPGQYGTAVGSVEEYVDDSDDGSGHIELEEPQRMVQQQKQQQQQVAAVSVAEAEAAAAKRRNEQREADLMKQYRGNPAAAFAAASEARARAEVVRMKREREARDVMTMKSMLQLKDGEGAKSGGGKGAGGNSNDKDEATTVAAVKDEEMDAQMKKHKKKMSTLEDLRNFAAIRERAVTNAASLTLTARVAAQAAKEAQGAAQAAAGKKGSSPTRSSGSAVAVSPTKGPALPSPMLRGEERSHVLSRAAAAVELHHEQQRQMQLQQQQADAPVPGGPLPPIDPQGLSGADQGPPLNEEEERTLSRLQARANELLRQRQGTFHERRMMGSRVALAERQRSRISGGLGGAGASDRHPPMGGLGSGGRGGPRGVGGGPGPGGPGGRSMFNRRPNGGAPDQLGSLGGGMDSRRRGNTRAQSAAQMLSIGSAPRGGTSPLASPGAASGTPGGVPPPPVPGGTNSDNNGNNPAVDAALAAASRHRNRIGDKSITDADRKAAELMSLEARMRVSAFMVNDSGNTSNNNKLADNNKPPPASNARRVSEVLSGNEAAAAAAAAAANRNHITELMVQNEQRAHEQRAHRLTGLMRAAEVQAAAQAMQQPGGNNNGPNIPPHLAMQRRLELARLQEQRNLQHRIAAEKGAQAAAALLSKAARRVSANSQRGGGPMLPDSVLSHEHNAAVAAQGGGVPQQQQPPRNNNSGGSNNKPHARRVSHTYSPPSSPRTTRKRKAFLMGPMQEPKLTKKSGPTNTAAFMSVEGQYDDANESSFAPPPAGEQQRHHHEFDAIGGMMMMMKRQGSTDSSSSAAGGTAGGAAPPPPAGTCQGPPPSTAPAAPAPPAVADERAAVEAMLAVASQP